MFNDAMDFLNSLNDQFDRFMKMDLEKTPNMYATIRLYNVLINHFDKKMVAVILGRLPIDVSLLDMEDTEMLQVFDSVCDKFAHFVIKMHAFLYKKYGQDFADTYLMEAAQTFKFTFKSN